MSHTSTITTTLKNLAALEAACKAKHLEYKIGPQSVKLFAGQVQGDFSVKLPGWNYPMVVDTRTGRAHFDTYNGDWGDIAEFDKFNQEYGLQVEEQLPEVQEMVAAGWQLERVRQPNGDATLRIYQD